MIFSSYDPSDVIKFTISSSLLNTLQFVIFSGIDGLNINSIENMSGLKSSDGTSLNATFASKSTLEFWSLGIEQMLKEENEKSISELKINSV